ncbi:hypothetical protein LA52FAK_43910 [Desulforhopalus sp. 52FAK]
MLVRGVNIQQLSFGTVSITNCSLMWQDKLNIDVDNLVLGEGQQGEKNKKKELRPAAISKTVQLLSYFLGNVNIQNVKIGTWQGVVSISQNEDGRYRVNLESEELELQASLELQGKTFVIDIVNCSSKKYRSTLAGHINVDLENMVATGKFSTIINKSFPVDLKFSADDKKLSFEGKEGGEIRSISPLVDLFGLDHSIQRWITDYLSGSRYHLQSFKGSLPWNDPKEILNTLEAEVRVDDTEYTFAPGLEAIKARYTDVFFTKGVLIIQPHEATFYGQSCGESWLDINFNDPKSILLTAYIKTRAVANDDILTLLKYYNITLPFKQLGGTTKTDLRLAIVLNKINVQAEGIFEIDEGTIEWDGKNYTAEDARITLVDSDVTIDRLKISYGDLLTAQVSGHIQAKQRSGDLDISLLKLDLKLGESQLDVDSSRPMRAKYHFDPGNHYLDVRPSSWMLDSLKLELEAFRAPVILDDLAIEMPPVQLGVPPGILLEVSGKFSIKKKHADFICALQKYHVNDLELMSPHVAVDIVYDQGFVLKTTESALWELNKMRIEVYPSDFKYGDDIFSVKKSRIRYGDFFDSYLAGYFNTKTKMGYYSLNKREVMSKDLEERLKLGKNVDIEVSGAGGKYLVSFPHFDLRITTDEEKNWSANFGDLSKMYSRSKILQKYQIKEGNLALSSVNGKKPYKISADIIVPYPLLVVDDVPVNALHITGMIEDRGVLATINRDLDLEYIDNTISISSNKIGYNISAIRQLAKDHFQSVSKTDEEPVKKSDAGKSFVFNVNANQSQIYIAPQSRILADTINLELHGGKLQMRLRHGSGKILLHQEEGHFMVDGNDLNDEFMGALIQNSRFHGGRMSMAAVGTFDGVTAILDIKNTVLKKLAIMNNLMAFIDTVPALATFSLPQYHTSGLPIDSAAVGVKYKNNVASFESIEVMSPEFHAKGKGEIDFLKNQIDMNIQLKTQASKNVGKIPVVGYMLTGKDDDESLTVKLEGRLDDPEVNYSLIKEIVTYPVDILRRTFKLPLNLVEKMGLQSTKTAIPAPAQ